MEINTAFPSAPVSRYVVSAPKRMRVNIMARQDARLSIRIDLPGGRFGPGKAQLLRAVAETGSISAAARTMNMSYARAWSLIRDMNETFDQKLVDTFAGGHRRGGASLTVAGRQVLELYESIIAAAERTAAGKLSRMVAIAG